ncbi:synaptic vesicle glycoprotein 2B [Trichonephila inaurata madagascariensis]|uniref:Synaptic vesicle glycoprotein 2B n=1 Tax=Trichonephila inaurata madagascariensis TaxID=2747483 RepID=A0A8X7CL20_9ARAC|nr:synaptic vesicle glycoprotein 2B [Trichonephila inaurata madagascariensis]
MNGPREAESESLLLKRDGSSYTEEAAGGVAGDELTEMDYVDADVSVLSQFHEDALAQWSHSDKGVGEAGDVRRECTQDAKAHSSQITQTSRETTSSYVAPRLEQKLPLTIRATWYPAPNLVIRLLVYEVSDRATAAIPPKRVGGSLPIVFTYYGEFLVKRHRGRHLSWLLTFWGIGGLFTALMAWLMITQPNAEGLGTRLSSWRVFLVVCSTPALLTIFGLFFLPESPRYLLECGQDVEAMYVYQKVFRINHKQSDEYPLSEMELPARPTPGASGGCLSDTLEAFETFWGSFMQILWPPYTGMTSVLLVVWTTTAFGFYGMSIWFPEQLRHLEAEKDGSHEILVVNRNLTQGRLEGLVEDRRYERVHFLNFTFEDATLSRCMFDECTFEKTVFRRVRSSKTFFIRSTFNKVDFERTDLYAFRFIDCKFKNSTFRHTVEEGCGLDLDLTTDLSDIFTENLIAQAAIIPGNIVSSFILDRFGRVRTMVTSLFFASASAFFIWFLDTRTTVIAFEALFNFISISGWNAVDVITTESYPATLRSTGYGFLSAISRLAAILGNLTFARFISVSRALPVLTTATVLMVGALASLKLKETKDALM